MRIQTADSRASDGIIKAHTQSLHTCRDTLKKACADREYTTPASALATPFDTTSIESALACAQEYGAHLKTVILVGIGGSDLGTRAVYDALWGYEDRRTMRHAPRLVCFDTIEPETLTRCNEIIESHNTPEEIVLVIISKSGSTVETVVNANVLYDVLGQKFGTEAAARRTLYIGDKNTHSDALATRGIRCIPMPTHIGGRYSVFTSVGLVPMALLGVDIRAFCEGARRAITASVEQDVGPAATLAALLFESYTIGYTTHELVLFHPEFETMGKWYRQLLAESLGKERSDGTRVGIMPSIFIGSTDLHSMGQLVFGGPRNRLTEFVAVPSVWKKSSELAENSPFTLSFLKNKHPADAVRAIYEGVRTAYRTHALPYVSVELESISPRELGAWMALHMTVVMYTAELFGINAFDQPAVETYKNETRRILQEG
jgi:glucose-6-phosphate isomerase